MLLHTQRVKFLLTFCLVLKLGQHSREQIMLKPNKKRECQSIWKTEGMFREQS